MTALRLIRSQRAGSLVTEQFSDVVTQAQRHPHRGKAAPGVHHPEDAHWVGGEEAHVQVLSQSPPGWRTVGDS